MAGAIDLFSGAQSIHGSNVFKVDKSPLDELSGGIEDIIGKQAQGGASGIATTFETFLRSILGFDPIEGLLEIGSEILGTTANLSAYFGNLELFLGELNPLDPHFNPILAAEQFIQTILLPVGLLASLDPFTGLLNLLQFPLLPIEQIVGLGGTLAGIIGTTLQALLGLNVATNQIGDLASKLNFNPAASAYDKYQAGDISTGYGACINTTTLTPTAARFGFFRISHPAEKRRIAMFAEKSAGVTGVYFDVYRINADGSATWVWTSTNQVNNVSSTALTPFECIIPAANAIVAAGADIYGIQARMTGSVGSTVTVLSNNNTPDGTTGNVLPKRFGGVRDPSSTAAPTSLTNTQLDAIWGAITPYIEFDILAPPPPAATIYDSFDDVNFSLNQWANYQTTIYTFFGQPIYPTVQSSCATFAGFTDGYEGGLTLQSLNNPTDSCRLGVQVRQASSTKAKAALNAANDWSSGVTLDITSSAISISTYTSFADTGTQRATGPYAVADGELVYLQYDGSTNTYTAFTDAAGVICAWHDGGSVVPHGTQYQYGAIRFAQIGGVRSAEFDSFKLWDTDQAVPVGSTPVTGGGGGVTPPAPVVTGSTFPMTFGAFILAEENTRLNVTNQPATISLTGASNKAIAAFTQPATAALSGTQKQTGTVSASLIPAIADLHNVIQPSGTMAAAVQAVQAALVGPRANYTDPFSDGAGALNSSWLNRLGTRSLVESASGIATPNADVDYAMATYALPMQSDNVRVSCTMLGGSATADILEIPLRSNNSNQVFAYCYNGGAWSIYTHTGTYATIFLGSPLASSTVQTWTTGDVISFEVTDNAYEIKKNGVAVTTWNDTASTYPYADVSHRDVGMGYYAQSGGSGSRGIDLWNAIDLPTPNPTALLGTNQLVTAALSGALTLPNGISATLQLVTAALSGAEIESGTMADSLQFATAAMIGAEVESGTMADSLQFATATLSGSQGANLLVANLQFATAALSGSQTQIGTLAANLQLATAAIAAGQGQTTVAATTAYATALMSGTGTESGSVAAVNQLTTAALSGAETESGTMAPVAQFATAAFSGSATVNTLLSFSDSFSGGAGSLAAPWTNRLAGRTMVQNASGVATPSADVGYAMATYNTALNTDNPKVSCVMAGTSGTADVLLIPLRSSNANQIFAYCSNGGVWSIYSSTGTYAALSIASPIVSSGATSWTAADVISFEAVGTTYVIRKNGTSVLTWIDSGAATYPYIDSSHRDVGVGYYAQSGGSGTRGVDTWSAFDQPVITPTNQLATAALSGAQTQSGTVAPTLQLATISVTAKETESGTLIANLQLATAALTGAEIESGSAAAVLQIATAALAALQSQAGTVAPTNQLATASFSGAESESGMMTVTNQFATASVLANYATKPSHNINRAPVIRSSTR